MKKELWEIKWYFWFIIGVMAAAAVTLGGQILAQILQNKALLQVSTNVGQLLFAVTFLVAIFAILVLLYEIVQASNANGEKLEIITQLLNRNRNFLAQISHGVRLSEAAKAIVFRDMDRQSLREAVLEKLHQQDFDATYAIIDNIARRAGYEELAKQLRAEADLYRNATEEERLNQVISHIDRLCARYEWNKAAEQIDRLLKSYSDSPRVQELPQLLADRKEHRKQELLAAWDDAIKRQATDQSLEILRELDTYLTPNEGLALQESARDVFRTKLHNLGVQFSLAVTSKHWDVALQTGEQIIKDFPNTRMAHEIREKMDVLKSKVLTPK
jgi:phosphopantetheine adenylyltransferase